MSSTVNISLGRVLSLRSGDGQEKIIGRGDFPNQEAVEGAGVTFFYLFFLMDRIYHSKSESCWVWLLLRQFHSFLRYWACVEWASKCVLPWIQPSHCLRARTIEWSESLRNDGDWAFSLLSPAHVSNSI